MEESMAVQLRELREEQHRLEQLLGHTALGASCESTNAPSPVAAVQHRCVRELSTSEANTAAGIASTNDPTATTTVAAPAAQSKTTSALLRPSRTQWSYQDRLKELETLKRKYEAYARTSMSQYFNSVGDFQGYKERRESRMKHVHPFTFESREMTKAPRIREQRAEDDRRARAAAMEGRQRHPLKAKPVPPSTFMNKYELMVEEWCQRKAAIELMSQERARAAKEEAEYVRLSAQSLRKTREELMGVVYGPDGKPVSKSEQRRRAQSADAAARAATHVNEVPLEVKMKLWPALSDHERVRMERIKYRAAVRKMEVDDEVRQVLPLLTSPTPGRCYDPAATANAVNAAILQATNATTATAGQCFGIGQAIHPTSAAVPAAVPSAGPLTAPAVVAVPASVPPPPLPTAGAVPAPPTSDVVPPPPPPPPSATLPQPAVTTTTTTTGAVGVPPPLPTLAPVPPPPSAAVPSAPPPPPGAAVPPSPAPHQSLSFLSTSSVSTPPLNVGSAGAGSPVPVPVPSSTVAVPAAVAGGAASAPPLVSSPSAVSAPSTATPLISLAPSSVASPASPLPPAPVPAPPPPASTATLPPSSPPPPPPLSSVPPAPATAAPTTVAPPLPSPAPPGAAAAAPATSVPPAAVPAAAPPTTPASHTATAVAAAASTTAPTVASAQDDREAAWRRYNPQLTFKPNVKPGVPNFEALWAKNKTELAEKKKAHPTTAPKPFDLTPSAKAEKVVGRRPTRSVTAVGPPARQPSRSASRKTKTDAKAAHPRSPSPPSMQDTRGPSAVGSAAPRGTRAHALRTESIYAHYVQQSEEHDRVPEEDEHYWRAVAQRQREVRQRLAGYLTDHHLEHERTIKAKVRALRSSMKENEKAAEERLEEMKRRVAEMPPVFAEPVHLHEESKARAEVEQSILKSLKETGLDGATINNILASSAANKEGDGGTDTGVAETNNATSSPSPDAAEGEKKDGEKAAEAPPSPTSATGKSASKPPKTKKGGDSGSSSSSSGSSSNSDNSSSDFESDTDSSTDSSKSDGAKKFSSQKKSSSAAAPSTTPSVPSAGSVPLPKPVGAKKDDEYSDDSFEDSSDSD